MIFDHRSRSRDCRRDTGRMDRRTIRVLRRLNEDSPFSQAQIVDALFETESSIGGEPYNCFIWKSQLSVRGTARSYEGTSINDVVY